MSEMEFSMNDQGQVKVRSIAGRISLQCGGVTSDNAFHYSEDVVSGQLARHETKRDSCTACWLRVNVRFSRRLVNESGDCLPQYSGWLVNIEAFRMHD